MPVLTKINSNVIADDAITGDKFAGDAYLANTTNQNISGTYSENRLYTSDAYTLSGNATVNSHLTLSSIKPTADVVLTAGGAYTITGTGVLSAGSLLAKERTDLTGMTGELGSPVTGTPAISGGFPAITGLGTVTSGTLSNGVTLASEVSFPTGHVIQTVGATNNTVRSITTCADSALLGVEKTITSTVANSNFTLFGTISVAMNNGHFGIGFFKDGLVTGTHLIYSTSQRDNAGNPDAGWYGWYLDTASSGDVPGTNPSISFFYDPGVHPAGYTFDLKLAAMGYSGHGPLYVNRDATIDGKSQITIQEIAP